jgi:hypothetical protein
MDDISIAKREAAIAAFTQWLDRYGENSFDHQIFFASRVGRSTKPLSYRKPLFGTLAVAPMMFCAAFIL